jgi:hypothetical protein
MNKFLCFLIGIVPTLIFFISFGIAGAVLFSNAKRNQGKYDASTKCLLLQYNYAVHTCKSCTTHCRKGCTTVCTSYKCYDETFVVTYPIFNTTTIIGVISTRNERQLHKLQVRINFYIDI